MKLRGLDIDDLLILAMLADNHSYGSISENLQISQSAVSQRLKKLQSYLGAGFICDSKRRTLTPEGMAFAKDCRDALLKLNRNFSNDGNIRKRAFELCH